MSPWLTVVGIGEDGFRLFADGGGLSSQMRLISGQINTLGKAKISGYDITSNERDDVAFDQCFSLDRVANAISNYLALGRGERVERLNGLLSTMVLNKTEICVSCFCRQTGASDAMW